MQWLIIIAVTLFVVLMNIAVTIKAFSHNLIDKNNETEYIVGMSQAMVMVDKKVLKAMLDEAKVLGSEIRVAIYEYDEKSQLWNKAKLCE